MEFLLLVFSIGLAILSFYIVAMLAVFPYLWFKAYLLVEKNQEIERKEKLGQDFLKKQKVQSKYPKLKEISERFLIIAFTWIPFLTIEILWLRTVWHFVMDVVFPKIFEYIPL